MGRLAGVPHEELNVVDPLQGSLPILGGPYIGLGQQRHSSGLDGAFGMSFSLRGVGRTCPSVPRADGR
jgi:hypothetical protein